jgi:hypothetical protein
MRQYDSPSRGPKTCFTPLPNPLFPYPLENEEEEKKRKKARTWPDVEA